MSLGAKETLSSGGAGTAGGGGGSPTRGWDKGGMGGAGRGAV